MISPFSPVQDQINAYFPPHTHPYRVLERKIADNIDQGSKVLDVGCGRNAATLAKFIGQAGTLYGVDVTEFTVDDENLILLREDASNMKSIESCSIDVAYSRSVMEHVKNPDSMYKEIHRVLKKGGIYIFLTPSIFDYASIISYLIPNKFHPYIVKTTEGRDEIDVFPAYYKSNSKSKIMNLAKSNGFVVREFEYIGQYPSYLAFNRVFFWLGCMYQKFVLKHRVLNPLQGWILCTIEK